MSVSGENSFEVMTEHARTALWVDPMCQFDMVGSVEICGTGEDFDVLICSSSPESRPKIEEAFAALGFETEGDENYPLDEFTSMRLNDVNVLVTDDSAFFEKWNRAVAVCKLVRDEFGSCERPLRVAIHQAIMD